MKAVEKGGLGLKDVLRYMEIPYETWESVGQMCLNFDEDRIASEKKAPVCSKMLQTGYFFEKKLLCTEALRTREV